MSATRPRAKSPSLPALLARHQNEDSHTEHVTALALHLFDEAHAWLGIPNIDRRLLELSCRLHDVGYSNGPEGHAETGARLLLDTGIAGVARSDVARIAAIVSLHSGVWKSTPDRVFAEPPDDVGQAKHQTMRLAAILRVADALDYGHLQDCSIVDVHHRRDEIIVRVASPYFPATAERADEKADLWRSVFDVGVRFERVRSKTMTAPPLIDAHMHPIEAARRLMMFQFRTITSNVKGAIEAKSSDPVHDIRVAIRRLRALLRVFREILPDEPCRRIEGQLRELTRALGPARDLDVWIEFLRDVGAESGFGGTKSWGELLRAQTDARAREQPAVRCALADSQVGAWKARLGLLLRIELRRLTETRQRTEVLEEITASALGKQLGRALRQSRRPNGKSMEELHALRVRLRRARYLGEFFTPVLDARVGKLTKRMHAAEQSLGRIHDLDTGLLRIRQGSLEAPRRLLRWMEQARANELETFDVAWKRVVESAWKPKVRRCLA